MNTTSGYDIVGDIHGHAGALQRLLAALDYECRDGVWRHAARQAVFVGDLIDRGPAQREVVDTVRAMVDSGTAFAVMGNHEFNAIAYATSDPDSGQPLRPNSAKNTAQHQAFLDAYSGAPREREEVLEWFRTLPVWLDLGKFRVVHACWDDDAMERLGAQLGAGNTLTDALLVAAGRPHTWQFNAVETLLKGKEVRLPEGHGYHDKENTPRRHIRVRWWDPDVATYRDAFMGPESGRGQVPDLPIEGRHLVGYGSEAVPCFLGHYWLEGKMQPLASNLACLDYSIARPGGRLAAYRFDGERRLECDKFVAVPANDDDVGGLPRPAGSQ